MEHFSNGAILLNIDVDVGVQQNLVVSLAFNPISHVAAQISKWVSEHRCKKWPHVPASALASFDTTEHKFSFFSLLVQTCMY